LPWKDECGRYTTKIKNIRGSPKSKSGLYSSQNSKGVTGVSGSERRTLTFSTGIGGAKAFIKVFNIEHDTNVFHIFLLYTKLLS